MASTRTQLQSVTAKSVGFPADVFYNAFGNCSVQLDEKVGSSAAYTVTPMWSNDGVNWVRLTSLTATVSAPSALTFAQTAINLSTNVITKNTHGLLTGDRVSWDASTGALNPLVDGEEYFVIRTGVNTFKLATDCANASSENAIDLTSLASEDTLTFGAKAALTDGEYIVLTDDAGLKWAAAVKKLVSVAQVDDLEFEAVADMVDGEYIVIKDSSGLSWAAAADFSGASPAPTGAIWAAIPAARKVQVGLTAATDAASVAALFEVGFNSLAGFSDVITLDDSAADGTMIVTQVVAGACDEPVSKLEDDSDVGGVTIAQTTDGVTATPAPTGAIWAAIPSARKVQVDLSAITTAADVAEAFETALDALEDFDAAFTSTVDTATVKFSPVVPGYYAVPVSKLADDSDAGTITSARTLLAVSDYAVTKLSNTGFSCSQLGAFSAPYWSLCIAISAGSMEADIKWASRG